MDQVVTRVPVPVWPLPGNDVVLDGYSPDVTFLMGSGDDEARPGPGADTYFGGSGSDDVWYRDDRDPVFVSLDDVADDGGGPRDDNIHSDFEPVPRGPYCGAVGRGDDTLVGSNGDNVIDGRQGNDTILGLGGNGTFLGLGNGEGFLLTGPVHLGSGQLGDPRGAEGTSHLHVVRPPSACWCKSAEALLPASRLASLRAGALLVPRDRLLLHRHAARFQHSVGDAGWPR